MTPTKAIRSMRVGARSVIRPRRAEEIARTFGRSLRDLGIRPRPITTLYRANHSEGDEHAPVVAVAVLACALAGIKMELPYLSTSSNMTFNIQRALRLIMVRARRSGADRTREAVPQAPMLEVTLHDAWRAAIAERRARRTHAADSVEVTARGA